jgi:L-lactate dehydrogenase (cytochrome)
MTVITNIEDLRRLAQKRVPRMFYDYADSGSWTESTYRANESDFQHQAAPARGGEHGKPQHRTTMVGRTWPCRWPSPHRPDRHAARRRRDPGGAAAEKFGVPFTLSTMSICSIEDVAKHAGEAASGSSST